MQEGMCLHEKKVPSNDGPSEERVPCLGGWWPKVSILRNIILVCKPVGMEKLIRVRVIRAQDNTYRGAVQ